MALMAQSNGARSQCAPIKSQLVFIFYFFHPSSNPKMARQASLSHTANEQQMIYFALKPLRRSVTIRSSILNLVSHVDRTAEGPHCCGRGADSISLLAEDDSRRPREAEVIPGVHGIRNAVGINHFLGLKKI